jgi:hypothetical protein
MKTMQIECGRGKKPGLEAPTGDTCKPITRRLPDRNVDSANRMRRTDQPTSGRGTKVARITEQ